MSRILIHLRHGLAAAFLSLLAAGCGGERRSEADPVDALPGARMEQLPAPPSDAWVDPEVIRERRGAAVEAHMELRGTEPLATSLGPTALPGQKLQIKPTVFDSAWAMYRFGDLLPTDAPHTLRIELDAAESSGDLYIGVSNYATGRWDWQVGAAQSNSVIAIHPEQDIISPGGNTYVAIAVSGEDVAVVSRLVLYFEDGLPPPQTFSASQGKYLGEVWLSGPWPAPGEKMLRFRGLAPDGVFEELPPGPDRPSEILGLPRGTPFYYRAAMQRGEHIGRMTEAVLGFEGFRPLALLDGTVLSQDGDIITVRLDPSRSLQGDYRPIARAEYNLSNGAQRIEHGGPSPIIEQFDLSQGQAWAEMRLFNTGGLQSIFGGVWVSCGPEGLDVRAIPSQPSPHESFQHHGGSVMTVDLAFDIDFGAGPYYVQLQTDFRGNFEASPYGTIVGVGSFASSGPAYVQGVDLPPYLPNHEHTFAVRVIDAAGDSRVFAWCTPVTVFRDE